MAEITVFFEGQRRDLNEFEFAIFDHAIRYDVPIKVPGDTTFTLRPDLLRRGVGPNFMEVVLNLGERFAAGPLADWLYAKWGKSGEPPSITVKIENHYYQFDPDVLTRALEDAAKSLVNRKGPGKAASGADTVLKARNKSQS